MDSYAEATDGCFPPWKIIDIFAMCLGLSKVLPPFIIKNVIAGLLDGVRASLFSILFSLSLSPFYLCPHPAPIECVMKRSKCRLAALPFRQLARSGTSVRCIWHYCPFLHYALFDLWRILTVQLRHSPLPGTWALLAIVLVKCGSRSLASRYSISYAVFVNGHSSWRILDYATKSSLEG